MKKYSSSNVNKLQSTRKCSVFGIAIVSVNIYSENIEGLEFQQQKHSNKSQTFKRLSQYT